MNIAMNYSIAVLGLRQQSQCFAGDFCIARDGKAEKQHEKKIGNIRSGGSYGNYVRLR